MWATIRLGLPIRLGLCGALHVLSSSEPALPLVVELEPPWEWREEPLLERLFSRSRVPSVEVAPDWSLGRLRVRSLGWLLQRSRRVLLDSSVRALGDFFGSSRS